MGAILAKDCICLDELPPYIFVGYESTSYSVLTATGAIESGWRLSRIPHRCFHNREGWQAAHAIEIDNEWRVFLYHDTPDTRTSTYNINYEIEHNCGWRRVSTVWPSHLTDPIERQAWQNCLIGHLVSLQAKSRALN
jgi:hypothetical protein